MAVLAVVATLKLMTVRLLELAWLVKETLAVLVLVQHHRAKVQVVVVVRGPSVVLVSLQPVAQAVLGLLQASRVHLLLGQAAVEEREPQTVPVALVVVVRQRQPPGWLVPLTLVVVEVVAMSNLLAAQAALAAQASSSSESVPHKQSDNERE
jgi:hypothetical protein